MGLTPDCYRLHQAKERLRTHFTTIYSEANAEMLVGILGDDAPAIEAACKRTANMRSNATRMNSAGEGMTSGFAVLLA
jgi:hypothetical protein